MGSHADPVVTDAATGSRPADRSAPRPRRAAGVRRARWGLLLASGLSVACASPAGRPSPPPSLEGRIYASDDARFIGEAELLERLRGERFVLLGERHDHPEHHRLQARVVRELAARGRRPAVAFEMLREDVAAPLEEARAREDATPAALGAAVDWDASGWPAFSLYEPVFAAALDAGLPIAAADLSTEALRQLRVGGADGLAPELREALRLDPPPESRQREALAEDVRTGHCELLPESLVPRMVDVQLARDAQLSRALDAAAAGADGAVLVAGAGHVRRDWAVPWWLRRRAPGADAVSLAFVEASPEQREPGPEAARFDYVWYTAPLDDEDPCEKFRDELEALGGHARTPLQSIPASADEARVDIPRLGSVDAQLAAWNDEMYRRHPTPYAGLAGWIERARVRTILDLAEVGPGDSVLEIGCESGHLLERIPAARRIVGTDVSRAALEDAAARFRERGRPARFYQLDAQQPLGFEPGEFDVILCSEMLEHVADPRAVMRHIHRVAGPQTRIVVSVPIEAPKLLAKRLLRSVGLFHRLFPAIEAGASEWHLQDFSKRGLLALCEGLFACPRMRTVAGTHRVALLRPDAADG